MPWGGVTTNRLLTGRPICSTLGGGCGGGVGAGGSRAKGLGGCWKELGDVTGVLQR